MSMGIKFSDSGIAQGLSTYDVTVPTYQRDYSWKAPFVSTYLEDISLAIQTDEPVYFLGSLVFIDRGENMREVVDGQQRLATTSLLLASMRQISGKESDISRGIERMILSGVIGKVDDPKMLLNSSDSPVFSSLITTGKAGNSFINSRTSHKRLVDAYKICHEFMASQSKYVPASDIGSLFETWVKYLQFNTQVILITVDDELNAFRMFETLNDRGMKVSQADLIKNYLFSKSKTKIAHAQEVWGSIRGTLESIDDDESIMNLIRYYLMSTKGFVEKKNIYKKMQEIVKGENSSMAMLNDLDKMAKLFVAIGNQSNSIWKEFSYAHKKNIEAICLFNLTAVKPLLLSSVELDKKECENVYSFLLSATVRLLLASRLRTTSASVERPISDCSVKISNGEITTAKGVKDYLSSTIPNDREFESEFIIASSSQPKFARYYLRSMENAHNNIDNPSHMISEDTQSVTLEHVLPRKPMDNWSNFDADEHAAFYKRLGNLALMNGDNMSSDSFEDKKPILKGSPFATTAMIGEFDEWNIDSIEKRQEALAKLAVKAWKL